MARRKPRVVWLPPDRSNRLGIAPVNITTATQTGEGIIALAVGGPAGTTQTEVVAVVTDAAPDVVIAGGLGTLADVAQAAYRLRRIVGKIHAGMPQDPNQAAPQPTSCLLTCGFIVLRVNEEDQLPLQNPAQYDAMSFGNNPDPWIWRRTWHLINEPGVANSPPAALNNQFGFGLVSTSHAGSVSDGPHVDAKTARVIGPEQRLFLVATTTSLGDGEGQVEAIVTVLFDLRVLASMRSSQGNRRNASR